MLARVAESLNWMARYIERAEDVTRLLAVNFNALLDTAAVDGYAGPPPFSLTLRAFDGATVAMIEM